MPAPAFLLNPQGVEDAYLEALHRNFGGWGGPAEFGWWFRRPVGGPPADLLVLTVEGDTLVAGTAVVYRRLRLGGREHLAGVMTGAWTADQYRRQGLFSELTERARRVCADRGAALMLAFCSSNHPVRNALSRASFGESEAWRTPGIGGVPPPDRRASRPGNADLHRWFHEHRAGAGIDYPTVQIFTEQSLLHDPMTRVVEAAGGLWGVLAAERSGGGVQAVISEELMPDPTAVAGALRIWGLPAYTTDPAVARKLTTASNMVFGLAVDGRAAPPPWPPRWSLQAMDRA